MTPEPNVARFPYVPRFPALGEASLAPLIPITLANVVRLETTGLVDSPQPPTGTLGSVPSSTQTQPYCVLLGLGSC